MLLWGTVTACAPARASKALCHSHPHGHSNLTAEANESHSWGWDAFACFSNGESPAGFFTQVLEQVHRRMLVFQVKNQLLKNSVPGATFKNTMCTVGRKWSYEQKPLNMSLPLRINLISTEIKLPSLSFTSASMTQSSVLSLFQTFLSISYGCLSSLS